MSSTGPSTPIARSVWTEADFETMGWHDNAVHAFAFEPAPPYPGRLLVDLDYIVEWVSPVPPETRFTFWMCPSTLVFDQAWDLSGDIDLLRSSFTLQLDALLRSEPDARGIHEWTLAGQEFTLRLFAKGFTQYLRRPAVRSVEQRLETAERGGLGFDQCGFAP